MKRILMPASGHQDDHEDSVHLLVNGRVPCGRTFAKNIHCMTDKPLTCEHCRQALQLKEN